MDQEKVGIVIKTLRKEKGMTQFQLSQMLNVTDRAVSKWEREECYPDITCLPDIASLLLCSVNDFFN